MNLQQKVILLIEDDPDNRRLTKDLLSFHNYHIIEAEDGYQAMNSLKKHTPDLILTDIDLPGIDGLTLTKNIRARKKFAHIPIIILTAYFRKADKEITQDTELLHYILKPVNIKNLLTQIQSLLNA